MDALLIPFSLLWGGFAIFWESTVLASGAPGFFALWGVPFVAVGLYLIGGRFFVDAWVRGGTRYVLTDQRAIIERLRAGYALTSLELPGQQISLSGMAADGTGTISFGAQLSPMSVLGRNQWGIWAPWLGTPTFEGVEGARALFEQIQTFTGRA
jgi:hypothetical protein